MVGDNASPVVFYFVLNIKLVKDLNSSNLLSEYSWIHVQEPAVFDHR